MKKFDYAVGGQAVIEGVMMRSKNFVAISVRKKNNEIKTKSFPYTALIQKHKWLNIPLIRGVVGMIEMMILGFKALNFSSDEYEEFVDDSKDKDTNKGYKQFLEILFLILNLIVSLGMAIALFKFVPLYITEMINKFFPVLMENYILYNLLDGILKILIFIGYIYLISFSKVIKRVFMYHGAEHKAVFNYEHNTPLIIENAQKESRFHPRCGTSFVIFVFIISVILYTFLPRDPSFALHFAKRVVWLPLIVGVSYEVLKYTAKYSSSKFVKILMAPGLAFQGLTTAEPDNDQVEVALTALKETQKLEEELMTTHTQS